MVLRQLELACRAQHAKTLHATQLANFDQERFPVITRRQFSTHHGTGYLDAGPGVGRTAHNRQQAGLTYIDLAHAQSVRVRVLLSQFDFAHHDLTEGWRHWLEFFNLQPRHGQCLRKFCSAQRWVAKLTQP